MENKIDINGFDNYQIMKKLVIYIRKNTPCHKWVKCSKPVVGDWIMIGNNDRKIAQEQEVTVGIYIIDDNSRYKIKEVNYEVLMDHIYSQYIVLYRDIKIDKILNDF